MKKILLIRFSSIGDIVLTTPVVRTLKKQLHCELHTVVKKKYAFLYRNNPYVDKVFSFDKSEKEILAPLKKEQYDFVIDLQKNLRSLNIKKALNTPAASFPKINIQKWMLVNFKIDRLPKVHIVDRYFKAVEKLGVINDNLGLDFFISPEDEPDVKKTHPFLAGNYLAIAIGGQHFTKILPAVKVAEIINKVDLPVVLLGGKEDFERGEEVLKLSSGKKVVNACGKYNLNQSASLVKQCSVLITNDTGLMHIGAAFKKPLISVWGNTVPEFGMTPYMPGYESNIFISEVKNLSCRPCSKLGYNHCPKKHFKCMMEQDTDGIVEKVNKFLNV
ncbi:MAG: glycosyl transferase [Bacteroidetes bacterium]|nr:MAG: glycosyl transferase [Bacteroidota bacterium]